MKTEKTAKKTIRFFVLVREIVGELNQLKFNAALSPLAEEPFIDKEELLSKETSEPVVG